MLVGHVAGALEGQVLLTVIITTAATTGTRAGAACPSPRAT